MRYVLDTNAVSALMKGDPRVVNRLQSLNKGDAAIPQPAIAENCLWNRTAATVETSNCTSQKQPFGECGLQGGRIFLRDQHEAAARREARG